MGFISKSAKISHYLFMNFSWPKSVSTKVFSADDRFFDKNKDTSEKQIQRIEVTVKEDIFPIIYSPQIQNFGLITHLRGFN
jgi:hypothetical protein